MARKRVPQPVDELTIPEDSTAVTEEDQVGSFLIDSKLFIVATVASFFQSFGADGLTIPDFLRMVALFREIHVEERLHSVEVAWRDMTGIGFVPRT